jgi:hypothetical protein
MRVTFRTSLEDWLAFAEHEMRVWAAYRDTTSIWLWSTAIVCGGIAAYVFADVSPGVGLGAGVAVLVGVAALFSRWTRRSALAQARNEVSRKENLPLFMSERTLETGPDGLRSETVVGSQLVRWAFVRAVQETPKHVFIHLPMRAGYVIPKSAVPGDALVTFLAELRQHVAE